MSTVKPIMWPLVLCAVSALILGCAQSGSPEVDPDAAAKARANVDKAPLSPPGIGGGPGR